MSSHMVPTLAEYEELALIKKADEIVADSEQAIRLARRKLETAEWMHDHHLAQAQAFRDEAARLKRNRLARESRAARLDE